jgi:hypothetical protein
MTCRSLIGASPEVPAYGNSLRADAGRSRASSLGPLAIGRSTTAAAIATAGRGAVATYAVVQGAAMAQDFGPD